MGLVLSASVLAAPKVSFAEEANNDVKKFNYKGNLYAVLDNENLECKSLDEMKIYAESLGGHLVYIENAEENQFVWDLIKAEGSKRSYVLGIHRDKDTREWKYYNGENVTYTNWAKGEPNREDEDYVHLYNTTGEWNNTVNIPRGDEDSFYRLSNMGMVVEWENEDTRNGHVYQLVDDADVKSLEDMKSYAKSVGGHLAYITDAEENQFVWDLIKAKGTKRSYVLGMYRDKDTRVWKYDNGEDVTYTNWAKGEPNREDEDYVHLYNTTGEWNNTVNVPRGDEDSFYRLSNMGMIIEWD